MSLNTRRVVWTVLCALQHVAGQLQEPPQNVTFYSKNFNVFLKWLPGFGYSSDVRYKVNYRLTSDREKWKTVPHCDNISRRECKMPCLKPDSKYKARVRAFLIAYKSTWKESEMSFRYTDDVELSAPQLQVKEAETYIIINAILHPPSCRTVFFLDLKYDLIFWEDGKGFKLNQSNLLLLEVVNISTAQLSGNYCMTARTSFTRTEPKHSAFSEPICMLLNHNPTNEWRVQVGIITLLLLFLVPAVAAFSLFMAFKRRIRAEMPLSLDFSHHKPPVQPEIGEPKELFSMVSHICTNGLSLQEMKDQCYSPLDDDDETISSCGGYIENHQFHQIDASSEDSNATQTHPYNNLSSTTGSESWSSDNLEHHESSHSLLGDNTSEEDLYCQCNKRTLISELCHEIDLPANDLQIEERNALCACALHVNVLNFYETDLASPLIAGRSHFDVPSESDLSRISKREPWTNKQYSVGSHSQQDVCPQLHIPCNFGDLNLKREQNICFQISMFTENIGLSDCSASVDWDKLLLEEEDSDQPITEEVNYHDQQCKVEMFQSAYISRKC